MTFIKGQTPWNKGTKGLTKPNGTSFKKGMKKSSKMFSFQKGNKVNLGRKYTKESYESHRKGWNWRGGICSAENRKEYKKLKSRERRVLELGCIGSHTQGEWELLKAQYGFTCPCCKKSEPKIKLTEDHIIPLVKGGSDFIENIQPLCHSCNSRKHTKIIKY